MSRARGLVSAKRQKNQLELAFGVAAKGEARDPATKGTEAGAATFRPESPVAVGPSMETIVARDNLRKALAQVRRNKGAPGIDGMTVKDLPLYLKDHWSSIRAQLLDGTYRPQPVLRVEIPKAGGGARALGIPTVLDRFIQQAVLQVLQADWDPTFSAASYGFRPGRSAHQAVARAQEYIATGHGPSRPPARPRSAARSGWLTGASSGSSAASWPRAYWRTGWLARRTRGPRKAVRCRPCCRI